MIIRNPEISKTDSRYKAQTKDNGNDSKDEDGQVAFAICTMSDKSSQCNGKGYEPQNPVKGLTDCESVVVVDCFYFPLLKNTVNGEISKSVKAHV